MNSKDPTSKTRLALHLADRALSPIFCSASSEATTDLSGVTQASALSSLTNTGVTAYDISQRVGAGTPLRIIVDTKRSGPLLLTSYLNTPLTGMRDNQNSLRNKARSSGSDIRDLGYRSDSDKIGLSNKYKEKYFTNTSDSTVERDFKNESQNTYGYSPSPPLLIASVIARSSSEAPEAKKAMTRLVKAGRECQVAWIKEHTEAHSSRVPLGESDV
ncbi:hypothetical protein GcM3_049013 [Golovinomyces cichoracearum]|uniref:Uncharacterized protein n=1 Tax=Golovinomyces cichoracearum TaxID=62708 RepID=A0A420IZY7_9PEZI|nr:hypothetical protein GcM3_049013 [Golovinomyces cichoracearum]